MGLIAVGARAPAFALADQSGATRRLADCAGQAVVLFFYPKDDTETCTKQVCAFRDDHSALTRAGAVVFGISPQDAASKAQFAGKHGLNYPILADDDARVCERYGVWQEKRMFNNTYLGVVRTTYLIDRDGRVAQRWDRVRVPGHAERVLKAAQAL